MAMRGAQFRTAKERGEWAEARFVARAAELMFRVAKPWGDSAPYDLMVERDGLIYRVQVKSTMRRMKGCSFPCTMPSGKRLTNILKEIDFVAAYVIMLDLLVHHSGSGGAEAEGAHLAGAITAEKQVRTLPGGVAFAAAVERWRIFGKG
jgi:hypothetical protein